MSLVVGELVGYLRLDNDKFDRDVDASGKKFTGMGSMMTKAAGMAAAAVGVAFGAVTAVITGTIDEASDLSESMSKSNVVFGEAAKAVEQFGDKAARAMGQSKQSAIEATATFGNLFVSMGMAQKQSADMSMSIVTLASDLASFNNTPVDEAILALRSGLVGETEPLRRFGINLNEAALRAEALRLGLNATTATLDPAVKAQAAYSLIMQQSTTAQGDYARTADGLANQQRTLSALWEDAKAKFGKGLMPVMQKGITWLSDHMDEITGAFVAFGNVLGGLAKAGGAVWSTFTHSPLEWFSTDVDEATKNLVLMIEALETTGATALEAAAGIAMVKDGTHEAAEAMRETADASAYMSNEFDQQFNRWQENKLAARAFNEELRTVRHEVAGDWKVPDLAGHYKGVFDGFMADLSKVEARYAGLFGTVTDASLDAKKNLKDYMDETKHDLAMADQFQTDMDRLAAMMPGASEEILMMAAERGPDFVHDLVGADPTIVAEAFADMERFAQLEAGGFASGLKDTFFRHGQSMAKSMVEGFESVPFNPTINALVPSGSGGGALQPTDPRYWGPSPTGAAPDRVGTTAAAIDFAPVVSELQAVQAEQRALGKQFAAQNDRLIQLKVSGAVA